jgi:site-specific recombinase XerD
MRKTLSNHLNLYRRHAPKCPLYGKPRITDQCKCPLWVHGRVKGKFVRRSLDTRQLGAAELKKDDWENGRGPDSLSAGVASMKPASQITAEEAAQEFFESKRKRSTGTKEIYKRAVGEFVRWAEGRSLTLLSEIDTPHLRQYFAERDPQWKLSTAYGRLTYLRTFFNFCRRRRWLAWSPAEDPDLNYGKGVSERLPFTPTQITQILAACERMPEEVRDRARALVLLLLHTGMRISDATFFEREYLNERHAADYYVIKNRRLIDLPPEVQAPALEALAKLPVMRVYYFQDDRDGDYLEARRALRSGQEFSPWMPNYRARVRQTTRLVEKVLSLAGIRHGREGGCHRFRDTFAINLLTNGVDVYTVSQFLGHSDVRITQKHYLKGKLISAYRERMSQSTRSLAYAA